MATRVTFSLHSTILSSLLPTRVFPLRNLINSHSSPKTHLLISPFTNSTYLHSSQSQQAYESTLLSDQRHSDAVGKRITSMEDPDPESEWAIQEYSPPKEDEITMMKWILNKGYVIGKKMVITGIAITSAPLVLPPLAVFSAMGVAVSVPFGLVFASYVCTNSLMNKLLPYQPTPASPLLLEYYADEDEDEEGVDCKFDLDENGDDYRQTEGALLYTNQYEDGELGKENVKQEEEEERIWDTEEGSESPNGYEEEEVEALKTNNVDEKGYSTDDEEKEGEDDEVIRLKNMVQVEYDDLMEANLEENEDEKEKEDQENVVQREYGIKEEEREQMEDMDQGIEDEKEKEDQDDVVQRKYDIEDEGREQMDDMNQGIEDENLKENEDEKEKEDQDDVLQREYDIKGEERKQMEDVNQGIEMRLGLDVAGDEHKQTQEASSTNSSGVDEQGYEEDDGEYLEEDDDRNKAEVVIEDEEEEIVKESTGLLEKIRDEGKLDDAMEHESASNEVFEEEKDVEMTEPVTVKEIESQKLVNDESKNDESVCEMHRVVIFAEGNEENNFNAREIEELDLVAREVGMESDEKVMKDHMEKTSGETTNNGSDQDAILKTKKEHLIDSNEDAREMSNTSIGDDKVKVKEDDVMSLPGFRHAPLDSDNDKVTSKKDRKTPSREDILEDEKIWEKIGAMRAIVGYKAPSHATCIGELKALYVFTGVEPPASFKDDSDRYEVNAKLKFLMSIVGVK